jgi:hypothetical protein
MNYKNRKPKKFRGCCLMCSCRKTVDGRKRRITLTEQRQLLDRGAE